MKSSEGIINTSSPESQLGCEVFTSFKVNAEGNGLGKPGD
jgi:hypothetical protein